MRRRLAVALLAAAAVFGARVHSAGAATYTVCGYGSSLPPVNVTCMSLPDAIAAAQATPEADTIRMLPGDYCPIDLEGAFGQPIRFVGVGIAGIDTSGGPVSLNGPEASLTTFVQDNLHCSASPQAAARIAASLTTPSPFVFQNVTFDATGTGSGYGIYAQGNFDLKLRDVIVENATNWGVYYFGGITFYDAEIENSLINANAYGVQLLGTGSIYDSTIVNNTHVGVEVQNTWLSMGSDTITHNGIGVDSPCCGSSEQIVDSIVAGNTQDCGQIADWESGYPNLPNSFGNLIGSWSCPIDSNGATNDVRDTSVVVPHMADNGGPTPSVMPPGSAQGIDQPNCGLGGVDQREFRNPGSSTCDAGAVQAAAAGTTAMSVADLDLGTVTPGSTTTGDVSLAVTGSDLVGVSGVSISGAGWSIVSDRCTFAVMESSFYSPQGSCSVTVGVHPTSGGVWNGTLTISTTAGTETAHLHAQTAGSPPSISTFLPQSGLPGTSVTITGTNLTAATGVAFNGTPAQSFQVNSDTQITAVVAAGTTSGPVSVTAPLGTATSTKAFIVPMYPPTVRSFSPLQAHYLGTVTIRGAHFTGATAVSFTGAAAASFLVVSDTVITAVVPGEAINGPISVTTPSGTAVSTQFFTFLYATPPPPTITGFSPDRGIHGAHVYIRGTYFTGATAVTFNGAPAAFTVLSDSLIVATVPFRATTGHIAVTTPSGTALSVGIFRPPTG